VGGKGGKKKREQNNSTLGQEWCQAIILIRPQSIDNPRRLLDEGEGEEGGEGVLYEQHVIVF